jgi:GxxExxY protein
MAHTQRQFETQRREGAKMIELSAEHEFLARHIVDAAYTVHSTFGPGLLETVYEQCLVHELRSRDLTVERQVSWPIRYRGIAIEGGFRLDAVVNGLVVVEIKSVERFVPVFEAQILTYLKLSGKHLGFLINFNVPLIKDGIRRFVR